MNPLPRFANLALKRCSENRERAFAQSAASVNNRVMHPPVPREKALVPISGPQNESFLPSFDYDEELAEGYSLKYGRA